MTVLVTGGSGFIGRNLVASLREAGAGVRVLDLEPFFDPAVETVRGDVADPEAVAAGLTDDVDAIVHLAAVTSVLRSVEQPELTHRTNVTGTAVLLEAARQAGIRRVVFASTNAVVGPSPGTISEKSPLRPLTPYGATKAAGEMLLSAYNASYGIRATCLRFPNVYGPLMQTKDSIVARLMRAIRLGTTFEIYGDGHQVRDYLHVSDVVAAIHQALDEDRWHGPVVLGAESSLSVLDMVEAVRRASGATLDVRHGPARQGEMPAVIVDTARARRLGWAPRVELDEGLIGVWKEWSTVEPAALSAPSYRVGGPGSGR